MRNTVLVLLFVSLLYPAILANFQLPFNYYDCIDASESMYNQIVKLSQDVKGNNLPLIVNETLSAMNYMYYALPTCGLEKLSDQLEEQIPKTCIQNLQSAFNLGYSCYQVKDQPVKLARCMPKATIAATKAQNSCPFLDSTADESAAQNMLMAIFQSEKFQATFSELESTQSFKLEKSQFIENQETKFQTCWAQITNFGLALTNWTDQVQYSNSTIAKIQASTTLFDFVYTLLPACGLGKIESIIDQQLPQSCVDNLSNAAVLGIQCNQVKDKPTKLTACMVKLTKAVSQAKATCPFLAEDATTIPAVAPAPTTNKLAEQNELLEIFF